MINIMTTPLLHEPHAMQYGFFTREGGVSTGPHASLNCAYASEDDPTNVQENRRRAMAHLGYPPEALITTKNIHGNTVAVVHDPWLEHQKPEADAMVTCLQNVVLGSDSADCPIVLLADPQVNVIGLAHAGWRSAKQGILDNTVKEMRLMGADPKNMVALIGPCIAQASYEVGPEFIEQFLKDSATHQQYFTPANRPHHALFDLRCYVRHCLEQLGLKQVCAIEMDTYTNEQLWFSCRRAYHRGEPDFGGHLAFICLRRIQ